MPCQTGPLNKALLVFWTAPRSEGEPLIQSVLFYVVTFFLQTYHRQKDKKRRAPKRWVLSRIASNTVFWAVSPYLELYVTKRLLSTSVALA